MLYKIKLNFPYNHYNFLRAYLSNRHCLVIKYGSAVIKLNKIQAKVPQGSVLGPVLYLLYTADIPSQSGTILGIFADDTAILASHQDCVLASRSLQSNLNDIGEWCKWRIKVNEVKSIQVYFCQQM